MKNYEPCPAGKEYVTDARIEGAPLCLARGDEYYYAEAVPLCPGGWQMRGYWLEREPVCGYNG